KNSRTHQIWLVALANSRDRCWRRNNRGKFELVARYSRQAFENRLLTLMGDPRNVAHAKKVIQEKHHREKHAPQAGTAAPHLAKKTQPVKKKEASQQQPHPLNADGAKPALASDSAPLAKSLVVLSKPKEMEYHARANIEKLAEESLTTEE